MNNQGDQLKYQEMSPEVTLVEFISTSASFHRVKRQTIKDLEWDILKVFEDNIMPANAAAWYMAKRKFYTGSGHMNELLPFLLKNYPKKFAISDNTVEFLEVYKKEVARRKMHEMIRQGMLAYFSHKVEEYGVYFFDPYYYETVEPFLASLKTLCNPRADNLPRSKLLTRFFKMHRKQFVYQSHSPYLVTISREPVEIRTNTVGIIVSMIDNQFGILQFPSGYGTEKAFFSAKALFNDGYLYHGDPMKLPPMEFDGYRVPTLSSKSKDGASMSFTWYAVLVWCGRKPNPKYCSTKEHLISSPYFHGQISPGTSVPNGCVSYNELVAKSPKASMFDAGKTGCMQVGEVLEMKRNGAVVSLGKNSKEMAFIPGWAHKNSKFPGNFLTTTQGVELALKDIITFCIDPGLEIGDYKSVGCNVTVLKHASDKKASNSGAHLESVGVSVVNVDKKKKKSRKKSISTSDKEQVTDPVDDKKRGKKALKKKSEVTEKKDEAQSPRKKPLPRFNYHTFLLNEKIEIEDVYDSDEDPSYLPPPSHDPELDYDEYSDGEITTEEQESIIKEAHSQDAFDKSELLMLKKKLDKITEESKLQVEEEEKNEKQKDVLATALDTVSEKIESAA